MNRTSRNIKLVLEYEGTRFHGWQVQDGKATVQGELGKAVAAITGKETTIFGSGRTDAGVHAIGQVANFKTPSKLALRSLMHALNAKLPEDIRVISAEEVPADFHAQFGAKSKLYRYSILNRDCSSPLLRTLAHFIRAPLDIDLMRAGGETLVGTHDFRAFGSEMSKKERSTRTLFSVNIQRSRDVVVLEFSGDGFLYNQVRAMVGTLIPVGLGLKPPGWVKEVLDSKDRSKAGANVPAKGLCLVSVTYSAPGK